MGFTRTNSALRTAALIALGAFTVHQLRYLAGYGSSAGAALGAQGHSYLSAVLPLLVVLVASALVGTLATAAFGARTRKVSRGAGWAFCAVTLIVIFTVQESAEGLLSAGHPGGIAALVGHGGWIALPIAVAVGRIVALLLDGLATVEQALARRPVRRLPRATSKLARPPTGAEPSNLTRRPLAFGLARRPPPAAV